MSKIAKLLVIGSLAFLTFAPTASARGFVVVGGGFYRPFYGGYGWYGPGWGYSPYGPYGYYPMANTGNVKIKTEMKDASVFVDGGYAGRAAKLKKFALRPGTHDIALKDTNGRTFYQERVNVMLGRTLEIRPDYTRH